MEERKKITTDKGTITSVVWTFDGIRMGHALSEYKELTSAAASGAADVVRLHFGLRGDYRFEYHQMNQAYDLIGGHHNMMFSNGFDMVVHNKTLVLETFGVQFPREMFLQFTENASDPLKRFAENIEAGKNAMLTDTWGAIDPGIQQSIQQVLQCKFTGDHKRLFLLSKSLELLMLSADACHMANEQQVLFLKTRADKEKIIAVRDLVNERAANPPSLTEIARSVGLNEYKLKRGFKEIFRTTVFGYLTEQRLQLARQYLLDTNRTAAEIAYELGYATPQHFNNAFKKKFGTTPLSLKNNP